MSGCALFDRPATQLFNKAFRLPPISLPPNAIQLDIGYVERPVGDPRMGPDLWSNTDELSSIDREHRTILASNGFRVGVVGSNPPQPLQEMLRMKPEFVDDPASERAKGMSGQSIVVQSGGRTEVLTSKPYPACTIVLPSRHGPIKRSLTNVICKYQITAHWLHPGWIELSFVPQIHYGEEKDRLSIGEGGWQHENRQLKETFIEQKFQVKLHLGEMVLLTSSDAEGGLGELFFRGPHPGTGR
jgi:hypothetical protein